MFVGHLAVALGARSVEPKVPLGAAVAAAFGLDLLWPVLVLVGVESVRVSPNETAFTHLAFDSYPWSHSLLMVMVWGVLAGAVAARLLGSRRTGVLLGILVVSHWILDFVTHQPDLPLWPGGPLVGLGLWNALWLTILLEGGLLALATGLYLRATSSRDRIGALAIYSLIGVCTIIWITQPWAPVPPSPIAVAWGAMILWLLPFWAHWAERHRAAGVRS